MQDNQCPFPPLPSLGQTFVAAFMQTAFTEFAKYAAAEMVREWAEPQRKRPHRQNRNRG
jgi:hypothetical protein